MKNNIWNWCDCAGWKLYWNAVGVFCQHHGTHCMFCGSKLNKEMLSRREEGQRVRQIVVEVTGDKKASVRSGRGTAHSWWYIDATATPEQKREVEKRCGAEKLLGYYYPDIGPGGDKACPNVSWRVNYNLARRK